MSGVIAALRRTLLSCTSLARGGRATQGTVVGAAGLSLSHPAQAADLFDPAFKKHILLGNGRYHNSTTDGGSTTKLHWAVTLTAVD